MRGLDADAVALTHQTIQLAFFMGERLLVTVRQKRSPDPLFVFNFGCLYRICMGIGETTDELYELIDIYHPVATYALERKS